MTKSELAKEYATIIPLLFSTTISGSLVDQISDSAGNGDEFAVCVHMIHRAKESCDYITLAEFIPDNWFDIFQDEFNEFLAFHRPRMLSHMSENMVGLPYSEVNKVLFYRKLAERFGFTASLAQELTDDIIIKSSRMQYFLELYGDVLEKDEKGQPILPSPFIAKFLSISHDEACRRIEETVPQNEIVPHILTELQPNSLSN